MVLHPRGSGEGNLSHGTCSLAGSINAMGCVDLTKLLTCAMSMILHALSTVSCWLRIRKNVPNVPGKTRLDDFDSSSDLFRVLERG